jgi:bacterioferritin (cytochrome b1)
MHFDKDRILTALNAAFSAKYYSLAQYVLDASPYVRPNEEHLLREIRLVAACDRRLADQLALAIEQLEGVPQLTVIDSAVASLNYLSLQYLADVLLQGLEKQLDLFDRGLALIREIELIGGAEGRMKAEANRVFLELHETTRGQILRLREILEVSRDTSFPPQTPVPLS